MLTMVASRMTISCETAMTASANQRFGVEGEGGVGINVRVGHAFRRVGAVRDGVLGGGCHSSSK